MIKSLEDLISVCKELNCQFRIFGSLIYAALKGNFYRRIGDIDCFIEIRFRERITSELKKKNHIKSNEKDEDIPSLLYFLGFRTESFIKGNIKISLMYSVFRENFIEIPIRFGLSYRIPYNLINQKYNLYGKEFKGLTPEAALCPLLFVREKTKRKTDLQVLLPFCNQKIVEEIKDTDTFFWIGKRIPFISAILSLKINRFLNRNYLTKF